MYIVAVLFNISYIASLFIDHYVEEDGECKYMEYPLVGHISRLLAASFHVVCDIVLIVILTRLAKKVPRSFTASYVLRAMMSDYVVKFIIVDTANIIVILLIYDYSLGSNVAWAVFYFIFFCGFNSVISLQFCLRPKLTNEITSNTHLTLSSFVLPGSLPTTTQSNFSSGGPLPPPKTG